jgi:hypothetical protein
MGVDIHSFAEVRTGGKWIKVEEDIFPEYGRNTSEPFGWRSYRIFGFLADVKNYSESPVICEPKGLPDDSEYLNSPSPYAYDYNPMSGKPIPVHERETVKSDIHDSYGFSYLTLKELLDYDYDQQMEDRRCTIEVEPRVFHGGETCEPGQGKMMTVMEFLGNSFFEHITILQTLGEPEDVRVVFWFS